MYKSYCQEEKKDFTSYTLNIGWGNFFSTNRNSRLPVFRFLPIRPGISRFFSMRLIVIFPPRLKMTAAGTHRHFPTGEKNGAIESLCGNVY